MSPSALRSRRRNIAKVKRLRSDRETAIIKRLIWQSCFDSAPRPSQRALARELCVWPSYVCKVERKALSEGMDALVHRQRVTASDRDEAGRFTTRIREQEPGLLAPATPRRLYESDPRVMMTDETIAETWRTAREEQRLLPGGPEPHYVRERQNRIPKRRD